MTTILDSSYVAPGTAAFSTLYPFMQPELPGCPELAMDQAILQTAISFLKDTGMWVSTSAPVTLTAGQSVYNFTPVAADQQVFKVIEATINDVPMFVGTASIQYPVISSATPTTFISGDESTSYRIWPTPSQANTVVYRYIGIPKKDATTLPQIITDQWGEAIAYGAKWRLMQRPGTAYYQPQLAQVNLVSYKAQVARARAVLAQGYLAKSAKVQPVWFGA